MNEGPALFCMAFLVCCLFAAAISSDSMASSLDMYELDDEEEDDDSRTERKAD